MKKILPLISIVLLILLSAHQPLYANPDSTLVVGTKHAPPFAIKNGDGSWSGITIDMWRKLADDLDLQYRLEERDLKGLVEGLANRSLDAAAAALTITAERETNFDFTHPFYNTGLSIATIIKGEGSLFKALSKVLSLQFLKVILALIGLLFAIGFLVWIFEHKHNDEQFGGGFLSGVANSFWWSAVTMTTVGYGDKSPRTLGGRLIGLVWMFAAIIIISSFTATITSVLTVSQLESPVNGPEDLPNVRVGTVANSTAAQYLKSKRIAFIGYTTAQEGLQAVKDGEIEAMVYDEPILKYLVKTKIKGNLRVLPSTFESQDYGIGLPNGSQLREPLNRAMLEIIHSDFWQETLHEYIGE